MNLFEKILKMRRNNRGETLVEVIVAMLILTIIVIPLLNSFGVTGRINLKSRNVQYATNVATNVLEGLKEYGISGSAMQMYDFERFRIVADTGEITLDYSECLKDFSTPLIYGDSNNPIECSIVSTGISAHGFMPRLEKEAVPENEEYNRDYAHKYYYYIKNIKEGTRYYDAHITLDANAFDPDKMTFETEEDAIRFKNSLGFNSFNMADLTTLNSRYSIVASPSGVYYQSVGEGDAEEYDNSKTPETEAVRVFQERYGVHMQNVYDTEIERTKLRNELIEEAIRKYFNYLGTGDFDVYMNPANVALRHAAYSYYISNFADEYQTYVDRGVSLEGDPIQVDTDTIEVGDLLGVNSILDPDVKARVFTSKIKRKTTITITYDESDAKHPYVVNSTVTFTLDQTGYVSGLVCDPADPDDAENAVYVCEGYFAPDTHFEAIDDIYLFQDAYKDSYGQFKEDVVELDYSGLGNMLLKGSDGKTSTPGFFIIWQYEYTMNEQTGNASFARTNDSITILFTGDKAQSDLITLYSDNMALPTTIRRDSPDEAVYQMYSMPNINSSSIVANRNFSDRAYNVTVEILEHDGTEVLYTLNTTIKE